MAGASEKHLSMDAQEKATALLQMFSFIRRQTPKLHIEAYL